MDREAFEKAFEGLKSLVLGDKDDPDDSLVRASEVLAEGWVLGFSLAEVGKPFQIIRTGEFDHPVYGKMIISLSDLKEMVKNFKNGIRGQNIPIDVDHKHELGAVGWFKELNGPVKVEGGHALFATAEWTSDGNKKVKGGAFKYFSPHFGSWKDPESGKQYHNVLMSGAITNFPFLKGMQPVALSEVEERMAENEEITNLKTRMDAFETSQKEITDGIASLTEAVKAKADPDPKPDPVPTPDPAPDPAPTPDPEPVNAQLSEALNSTRALREELDAEKKKLAEAETALKLIEKDKRVMKFNELINGKHGDDPHWIGDKEKHLRLMESLADAHGEDSQEFKDYIDMQSAHARQIEESGLFKEIGTTAVASIDENQALAETVRKLRESDSNLTQQQALDKALSENPKFYKQYNEAHMDKVSKAGG